MSTTCQQIIQRAVQFSTANAGLATDAAEMIARIAAEQRAVFADMLAADPDYLAFTQSIAVTSGAVTLPVLAQAVLDVETATTPRVRATRVDRLDVGAALAPRYLVQGRVLREVVAGELGSAVWLTYATGPTPLDPAGGPAQAVSVPDEWVDVLVVPLAQYLATKDLGRPAEEIAQLAAMAGQRRGAFLAWIAAQGGRIVRGSVPTRPRAGEGGPTGGGAA